MKLLIIGVSGFIGNHFLSHLLKKKINIIGTSRKKISHSGNFRNITLDVTKKKDFIKLEKYKFDYIIYLAAFSSPSKSVKNKNKALSINIGGLRNTIAYYKKFTPKAKFIYVSSSAVYENVRNKIKFKPIKNLPNQITPYGYSKYQSEKFIERQCFSNNYIIIRPFAIIGANKYNDVCSDVIQQFINSGLKKNIKISLGNDKSVRDFVYIDDFTKGLEVLMKKGKHKGIYNFSSGIPTKITQLCVIASKILKKKYLIKKNKKFIRNIDTSYLVGDNQKIIELGCTLKVNLKSAIKKIITNRLNNL